MQLNDIRKDRLATLFARRKRKESGNTLGPKLEKLNISYSWLSDESQETLIAQLQSPGELLHERVKRLNFQSASGAFDFLKNTDVSQLPSLSVFVSYDIKGGRAFVAPLQQTLQQLERNKYLLSEDGFLILAPDGLAGAIVDFQESGAPFEVELTLLGAAAGDARKARSGPR